MENHAADVPSKEECSVLLQNKYAQANCLIKNGTPC